MSIAKKDKYSVKALEELQRYEMLPPGSGEASVARSYLDWLLKVPWWQKTEDNENLKDVQAILDEDHYGLKKVKERVATGLDSIESPVVAIA